MRVLLIGHGFPPAASGGTEIYVRHFARALAALPGPSTVEVFVLTRDADSGRAEYSLRQERTADGLTVFRINNTFQACTTFEDSYANSVLGTVRSEERRVGKEGRAGRESRSYRENAQGREARG